MHRPSNSEPWRSQVQAPREQAWWDRAGPEHLAHAYETLAAQRTSTPTSPKRTWARATKESKDTYFRLPTPAEAAAAEEVAVPRAPRLSRRSLVPALCWLAGGLFFRLVVGWHGDLTRWIIILAAIVALASFGRYVMKVSDFRARLRNYRLRRAEQAAR